MSISMLSHELLYCPVPDDENLVVTWQFGAAAPFGAATSGPRVADGDGLYRHESASPGAGITAPDVGTMLGAPDGGPSTCNVYWPALPSPGSKRSTWRRLPASSVVSSAR